jgi:hypothetical protein
MSVLWFAVAIYIVGIAIILFIRPTYMFNASGWKEFGLANTANYTIFPFWMFTIVWAVVSYAIASFLATSLANIVIGEDTAGNNINLNTIATPISRVSAPTPVAPTSSASATLPGYYILEESAKGPAKYVYFGPNPPTVANVSSS